MFLKRLAASKNYPIKRKEYRLTVAPKAGPHSKNECIPIQIILRDILNVAKTGAEAKNVLKLGKIMVDGRIRKDHAYPCGLMDVVKIPALNTQYRIIPVNGKLTLINISDEESKIKLCKITDKRYIKGNKMQINLHDGKNITVPKNEGEKYKTAGTLVITVPEQKIKEYLPIEKGMTTIVTNGKHTGLIGKVTDIEMIKSPQPNRATIEAANGEKTTTRLKYLFVIGKEKPVIKISE